MSRRIGLGRRLPSSGRPMDPHSQSQESTQQPSIEIRPSALGQPFFLTTPGREVSEPAAQSNLNEHSSNGASLPNGAADASIEETGDSKVHWSQHRTAETQGAVGDQDNGCEEGGLEVTREVSEAALTSPEVLPDHPIKPITSTHSLSRPGSSQSEIDELDDPLSGGELEATEVDDIPNVPSPSNSQPSPAGPSRAVRSTLPVPAAVAILTSPQAVMSPITSHSPNLTHAKRKPKNPSVNISPSRVVGKRSSLKHSRSKRDGSPQSDDSSFGRDASAKVKPIDMLNNLTRKYSKPQQMSTAGHPNGLPAAPQEGSGLEESLADPPPNEDLADEGTERGSNGSESEEDNLNWNGSISPPQPQGNGLALFPPSSSPALPARMNAATPPPYQQRTPEADTSRRFNRFAITPTTSQRLQGDSDALFSSQGFGSGDAPMSQESHVFQATQMVAGQPSSPSQSPFLEETQSNIELEATQPDLQDEAGPQDDPDHTPRHPLQLPAPSTSMLVKAPSVASTTTSSRIEVPAYRQLQRRSRVEDDSAISPIIRHLPVLPAIPGSSDPPRLQNFHSAIPQIRTSSSPFRKSSPVRRSSEPPLLQETLQEPVLDRVPPQAIQVDGNEHPPSETAPSPQHTSSPARLAGTTPPRPSSPATVILHAPISPHVPDSTYTDGPSLPPAPPVKTSPQKQYGGPASKRRRIVSPAASHSSHSPVDTNEESSSAPEDEDDHTYHPISRTAKHPTPRISSPIPALKSTSTKRKRVIASPSSILSSPPASDGGSSSSAPEDPEDNTYQPTLLAKPNNVKGKEKEKPVGPSGPSSRSSSRPPAPKKLKTNARAARLSTPLTTATPPAIAPDLPDRVLAVYASHYYPATVIGRTPKGFSILFDDGDTKEKVPASRMRKLILRQGDTIEAARGREGLPKHFEVAVDWDGNDGGVKCKIPGRSLGRVPLRFIAIRTAIINSQFGDRLFVDNGVNGVLGPAGERLIGSSRRSSLPRSPVKLNIFTAANGIGNGIALGSPSKRGRSVSPTKSTSNLFNGILFLITKGENAAEASRQLIDLVHSHGGVTVNSWSDILDPASPGECAFIEGLPGTPFLIPTGDKVLTTPKLMAALAKGIPCLSPRFVEDSVANNERVDWRGYLISSGYSEHTGQNMSQIVDLSWGEEGWDARRAIPPRRPFKGKKVLFVQPTAKSYETLKALVPVCLYLLGVDEFQAVQNNNYYTNVIHDAKWDYVLYEMRDTKTCPAVLRSLDNLCDIPWFKQCLIMGAAIPPSLDADSRAKKEGKIGKKK